VARLIDEGLSTRQVADRLSISDELPDGARPPSLVWSGSTKRTGQVKYPKRCWQQGAAQGDSQTVGAGPRDEIIGADSAQGMSPWEQSVPGEQIVWQVSLGDGGWLEHAAAFAHPELMQQIAAYLGPQNP